MKWFASGIADSSKVKPQIHLLAFNPLRFSLRMEMAVFQLFGYRINGNKINMQWGGFKLDEKIFPQSDSSEKMKLASQPL